MSMPHAANLNPFQRLGVTAQQLKVTAMVSTGILLANVLDRGDMVVHANDPWTRQAELSLPSALPAAQFNGPGHETTDVIGDIGLTGISLLAAQKTTSKKELAVMAAAAQIAGCGADAITERTGWLTYAERAQEDVGFSSISVAWFFKFLLDSAAKSKDKARLWYAGAAGFALTMAGALPLYEGSQGGKLDAVSHLAGLAVGAAAYGIGKRKSEREFKASRP